MADPHGAEACSHKPATLFQRERGRKEKESTMSSELMLDVGQANELKLALRRSRYTNDEIKKLCEGNILADVRNVLRGFSEIKVIKHVIDCDADPYVPPGSELLTHRKSGLLVWNPESVKLYMTEPQHKEHVLACTVRDRLFLDHKPVMNACVLDYLFAHPHLVTEQKKFNEDTCPVFWGTIYRDIESSRQFVRYLVPCGAQRIDSRRIWLDETMYKQPAALYIAKN